jgi:hypothetical protein
MKRQTDNLSFLFWKNLAYAEQNNSILWTKDHTLLWKYFTQNLAFIKCTLAKLGGTNRKDNFGSKDRSGETFCSGVSPVFSKTLSVRRSKS